MFARRNVRIAAAVMFALAWAGTPILRAADDTPAAKEKAAAEGKAKKAPAEYRGPLPMYYAKVVSPEQKGCW